MFLVVFTLLNGCISEAEYSIDSKFLYSADSLIYYENMNEFNVGNDIYLTIELMHSVSINQNEGVEIEISFPISDTFDILYIAGQNLELQYDYKNNLIVLKPVLLFNKISTFGLKVGMQIHLIPSEMTELRFS